jgi:hypothetical protein
MREAVLSAEACLKRGECRRYLHDVIIKKTDPADSYNALLGVLILLYQSE